MGENTQLSGLGKLYFAPKADIKPGVPLDEQPWQEVDLNDKAPLCKGDETDGSSTDYSNKGFCITGTMTIESTKRLKKQFKAMLCGEGRLPRCEKKRRLNRVLRDKDRCQFFARLLPVNPQMADGYMAMLLFPERLQGNTVILHPVELRLLNLLKKRISRMKVTSNKTN